MTDELDEILSKQDWGYEYQMSDYATSKAAELEYEREGKAKIAELKQAIQALIDRECTKARIDELIGVRGWTEYEPDPKYSPAERFHIVPYTYLTKRIEELKRSKE